MSPFEIDTLFSSIFIDESCKNSKKANRKWGQLIEVITCPIMQDMPCLLVNFIEQQQESFKEFQRDNGVYMRWIMDNYAFDLFLD